MSMTCVIKGCSNSSKKLKQWKESKCSVHGVLFSNVACSCEPPFKLFPFPTEKKRKETRDIWIKLVNRIDKYGNLWQPSKDSRICSRHFTDGYPSPSNPYPIVEMGYPDADKRAQLFSPPGKKRKSTFKLADKKPKKFHTKSKINQPPLLSSSVQTTNRHNVVSSSALSTRASEESVISTNDQSTTTSAEESNSTTTNTVQRTASIENASVEDTPSFLGTFDNDIDKLPSSDNNVLSKSISPIDFLQLFYCLIFLLEILISEIKAKEKEITLLKEERSKSMTDKLITDDKKCKFYTNMDNIKLFDILHAKISPLLKRRFRHSTTETSSRLFVRTPQKMGPPRKLSSKDEFLLTLIKLRLGLPNTDLAVHFGISDGLCTNIFHSWLRAMSEYLKSFVFTPDVETILSTMPDRFRKFNHLMGIIDCSEIFIETSKNLELQSVTWSDYKHHNTLKFLVCVAPNSAITFISKAYTGRISDKKITNDCKFLDQIPPYTSIMADKGFNLFDECASRHIQFIVPPGRRGSSQMYSSDVSKTSAIAKVRILVEQVIRRLKTFKIIANELPITMLDNIDDILIVTAALCNFKEPLYND